MYKVYENDQLIREFKNATDCYDFFEDRYCDDYGSLASRYGARIVKPTYSRPAKWHKKITH